LFDAAGTGAESFGIRPNGASIVVSALRTMQAARSEAAEHYRTAERYQRAELVRP
jgi:hypothetical protein